MLPGCAKPPRFDGSFIQPWRSHLDLGAQDWQQHMALAQHLGCRQIVVQWAGLYGSGGDADWTLPDSTMQLIFSTAGAGLQVGVGLARVARARLLHRIGGDAHRDRPDPAHDLLRLRTDRIQG